MIASPFPGCPMNRECSQIKSLIQKKSSTDDSQINFDVLNGDNWSLKNLRCIVSFTHTVDKWQHVL